MSDTDRPAALDGQRVIRLLWDPPDPVPSRGPRPRTSLVDVVAAGVGVADAEGLSAVSMRKVAQQVGIGAMSLYTYVPGRAELIELMIDRVYGEAAPSPDPAPWLVRLERWARTTWQLYVGHPWLLEYNDARLPIGPNVHGQLRGALRDPARGRLPRGGQRRRGQPGALATPRRGPLDLGDADESRRTGVTSDDYWNSRDSFWTTYFDYARFPAMAAVHEAGGFDDPAGWDFDQMLNRMLTGISQPASGVTLTAAE